MKHTPGPWKVQKYLTQGQFVTIITDMAQAFKMILLLRVAMDRVYGIENPAFGLSSENSLAEQILELLEGLSR